MGEEGKKFEIVNAKFNAILQSSYDGIYITDGKGLILDLNSRMQRIIGLKKEELIGSYAQDLIGKGVIHRSVIQMAIEAKERITINQTIKAEKLKEVMITATPILDEVGEVEYIVANLRDMTDLINLENECNKAQLLSKQYYSQLIMEKNYKEKIIAESEEMKQLMNLAYRVAQVDSTVLLEGESGTGKEVFTRFIHEMSSRNNGPFISINCAGIPETLLEAELFGYEEGAFTGAKKGGKAGLLELAEGGTLFLDEINSLPIALQGKILRVLETFEVTRIGSVKSNRVNFRLISATNEKLEELIDKKLFRQDLYFRLRIVPIYIPPLRKRNKDVVPLIMHYLKYFNKKYKRNKEISVDALEYLEAYDWPGNVRELKNVIERLVVVTVNDLITEKELPNEFITSISSNDKFHIILKDIVPLKDLMDQAETQLINLAMERCTSTREAAKALNISQTSVVRKFKDARTRLSD
ncbi:MAG: sigma 54-interacting transcriptional regulator [Clostridium sp.]|nr:sigma 54-interacting transcriptional regulator [Clostridium sp.]